jgi:hypothetical protein
MGDWSKGRQENESHMTWNQVKKERMIHDKIENTPVLVLYWQLTIKVFSLLKDPQKIPHSR